MTQIFQTSADPRELSRVLVGPFSSTREKRISVYLRKSAFNLPPD